MSLLWLGCYFNKVDKSVKLFTGGWNLWGYGNGLQVVGEDVSLVEFMYVVFIACQVELS